MKEQEAFLDTKCKERETIQADIKKLSEARKKHVAEVKRNQSDAERETLDDVVIKSLREQAKAKNIEFN